MRFSQATEPPLSPSCGNRRASWIWGARFSKFIEQSRHLGHVPIVDPKASGGPKSQAKAIPMGKPKRELTWAEQDRYKERTMVERTNARLKDEFGGRNVRVRGAAKVMAHLMFGVLALTVDQLLKLAV